MLLGVISDTHNLLRPEAVAALNGVDHIIHAGDVCEPAILDSLATIAPLTVVRGNNDQGKWSRTYPLTEFIELEGIYCYVVHDLADLDLDPVAAQVALVIHGHSHRPTWVERDGVQYLNPGSAGPRRFRLPITLARVEITAGQATVEMVTLLPSSAA